MPVYHSSAYYGLAWAIIIVACAIGLLVLIGTAAAWVVEVLT